MNNEFMDAFLNKIKQDYKERHETLGIEEIGWEKIKQYKNNYLPLKCVEEYEKEIGKKFYEFTKDETINMYLQMNDKSISTLIRYLTIYNTFLRFCNEKFGIEPNSKVEIQEFYELMKNYRGGSIYIDREFLLDEISELSNPRDKFLMLSLYEGFAGKKLKDIWAFSYSDLYGDKATLSSGRTITISQELIDISKESCLTYIYYPYRYGKLKLSTSNFEMHDQVVEGKEDKYMFKLMYNQDFNDDPNVIDLSETKMQKNIYSAFIRTIGALNKFPSKLKMTDIIESGILYNLLKKSQEKNLEPTEYLWSSDFLKFVLFQYGKQRFNRKIFEAKYKYYLKRQ